ncbi:urate oxidase [Nakamurella panacisegetis]|uniref:Uricase n=1 Tax=Nakamurella panacisegetis TaxID=1090615 RepID=A0A1H0K5G0_9ACTN|nr:urate oxidase [Nakamurella panacisegetis]SDO51126.1 urate oxidase [Nakamurella panacisegetis]
MAIVLGTNRYGKAEVRLVHVDRTTPVHVITDLNVTSQLIGDFADTHLTGANDKVIATDTQKNTIYALARRDGIGAIEEFGLRLARNYVGTYAYVTGARMEIEQYAWDRIQTADGPHDHSFTRGPATVRTTVVKKGTGASAATGDVGRASAATGDVGRASAATGDVGRASAATGDVGRASVATPGLNGDETVISGVSGLIVLKSTGSEFHGFPDVPYTSLVETDDRVMATSVTSRWVYNTLEVDFDSVFASVKAILLEQFAVVHSLSLQQTLFAMGRSVLEAHPQISEIRLSMPNLHHFVVDLGKWDLDNPNMVFYAADRPYGLIEAAVVRDDAPVPPGTWDGVAGFV